MFIKQGESLNILRIENADSCIPNIDENVLNDFKKTATSLKRIAPKADDFLYFSAVMMHAAEASALNEDGTPKLTLKGEAVKVGWDTSGNTWRWQTNDPMVKPYKNCFVSGTQITMSDGSIKNIEDVEPGDMVISHSGKPNKVLRKFITPHSGNLTKLNISNSLSITATSNHPFYVKNNNEYKFVAANKLEKSNILLHPIINLVVDSDINHNKARIFGLYAAEGNLVKKKGIKKGVIFSFGSHEKDNLAKELISLVSQEYSNAKISKHTTPSQPSKFTVSVYSTEFAHDCYEYVGEYSKQKKLSDKIVFGNKEVKLGFITGWLEGDGHVDKLSGKIVGTTTSPHLANQVRVMLNGVGISNSHYYDNNNHKSNINGREIISDGAYRVKIPYNYGKDLIKNSNKLNFDLNVKNIKRNVFSENFRSHKILKNTNINYVGNVYNLEVETDNTYLANGIIVHNCNGDIFPEGELVKAYKKWVGKPLCIDHKSSSVDHVRGFIVDTYYDRNLKRVIALCALDKKNYPDLAFKVSSGCSRSVSMGTAVGQAVCTDCACVARTEADFCDHMRRKNGYGEINIDLNPIELSIVVNGADPKAHIKHVIAAANTLNTYVENKANELNSIAEKYFSATLSVGNSEQSSGKNATFTINTNDLDKFKSDLEEAVSKLNEINSEASEENSETDTNYLVSNQSESAQDMVEGSENGVEPALAPPHQRFASTVNMETSSVNELRRVTANIQVTLSQMKENLDKLTNIVITSKQEENMSGSKENINKKAYYQGTEEPSPGQSKYPKDPTNEKLRTDGDKHMEGQMDTGPVEGMHPGPDSVGMSELERKKMLARAAAEERAIRRTAIVDLAKKAYYQGGGGANEPTPGKVKYPADKLNEQLRDKEDKQMVGQKPFPGVGSVDGLHPSPSSADVADELKRKEMLRRAGLKARFITAQKDDGSTDIKNSSWEVYSGDKLLLTASVDELTNGRSEMLYDSIATKEFGAKLINTIKAEGANKVLRMVKQGQEAPVAPVPAAPAPEAAPPVDMGQPEAPVVEDQGKTGDPSEVASEKAQQNVELAADLKEAIDALTGHQKEMGEVSGVGELALPEMGATASFGTSTLRKLGAEINAGLIESMKQSLADLKDNEEELNMIVGMYDRGSINAANKDIANAIVKETFAQSDALISNGFELMSAFVKYARGTQVIAKRAAIEAELTKLANVEGDEPMDLNDSDTELADLEKLLEGDKFGNEVVEGDSLLTDRIYDEEGEDGLSDIEEVDVDSALSDDNDVTVELAKGLPVPGGLTEKDTVVVASLNTKTGRAALRAKLAADALKTSPHLHEAHPKGGFTTELDVKPSGDLAKVEDLEEVHDAMMDLANAPVKVRKQAESIHKLISEGALDVADLDSLVAQGADKDAVAYYKKYWGQVDGGSEFVSELLKEHAKASIQSEVDAYKVKIARAYELAYDMVDRGICPGDRLAVTAQVEEIMGCDEQGFETLKRVVARHAPAMRKQAGKIPQVGLLGSGEVASAPSEGSLKDELSAAFAGPSKRNF